MIPRFKFVTTTTIFLCLLGCGTSASRYLTQREDFLLLDEPAGAIGVLELSETIEGEQDVVIVGQIGGVTDPWSPGLANFVMADPVAIIEGEGHPESCDCPFCKKTAEQAEGLALVEFLNKHGEVLRVDAQKLFDIEKDLMVVVRGRARMDDLGHLVVAARGLYVRR